MLTCESLLDGFYYAYVGRWSDTFDDLINDIMEIGVQEACDTALQRIAMITVNHENRKASDSYTMHTGPATALTLPESALDDTDGRFVPPAHLSHATGEDPAYDSYTLPRYGRGSSV